MNIQKIKIVDKIESKIEAVAADKGGFQTVFNGLLWVIVLVGFVMMMH